MSIQYLVEKPNKSVEAGWAQYVKGEQKQCKI